MNQQQDVSSIDFWNAQNETGGINRFLEKVRNSILIVDEGFKQIFGASVHESCNVVCLSQNQIDEYSIFSAVQNIHTPGKNIVVMMLSGRTVVEKTIKSIIDTSKTRIISFPYEIFISACNADNRWMQPNRIDFPAEVIYSIVCTARSGSTLLSDLLARQGMGNPKEHLRLPFIKLVENQASLGVDIETLLGCLISQTQKEGVFATKIISGFYWPIFDQISINDKHTFDRLIWSQPKIYIYRSSKVDQAISDFIARSTKTWHVRSESEDSDYQARLQAIEYNFEAILQRYVQYIGDEKRLRSFLLPMSRLLTVDYDDLVNSPNETMRKCLDFIQPGVDHSAAVQDSPLRRLASDVNVQLRDRFLNDVKIRGALEHLKDEPLAAEIH